MEVNMHNYYILIGIALMPLLFLLLPLDFPSLREMLAESNQAELLGNNEIITS